MVESVQSQQIAYSCKLKVIKCYDNMKFYNGDIICNYFNWLSMQKIEKYPENSSCDLWSLKLVDIYTLKTSDKY